LKGKMQTTAFAAIRQPRATAPIDARDMRDPTDLPPKVTVDLYRLQKTLFRDAGDAPIGQQIEVLALRLDQGQPHLDAALDAGHLDGGLKSRTGRRRPGYLQHRTLVLPGGDATLPTRAIGPPSLCQIPDINGTGPAAWKLVSTRIPAGFRTPCCRTRKDGRSFGYLISEVPNWSRGLAGLGEEPALEFCRRP
jgi:hypothetical protein